MKVRKKENKGFRFGRALLTALLAAVTAGMLSGCTLFDVSVEGMLSPPKLTEAQTAIYNALILNTGRQIELVYPKTGDYRSPFVFYDLDGTDDEKGDDEAIVFYRENAASQGQNQNDLQDRKESSLRMNILDQRDGVWVSVCDRPLSGVDIDSISFCSLFGNGRPTDIMVNCTVLNRTEKRLYVLEYDGDSLFEHYTGSYSFLERVSFSENDTPKLFLVNYDTPLKSNTVSIVGSHLPSEYEINNGNANKGEPVFGVISSVPLASGSASILRVTKQRINDANHIFFLDYSLGENSYGSEVLFYRDNYLSPADFGFGEESIRRSNSNVPVLYCTDIDGDGRVEIPITYPMGGYETLTVPEQMLFVDWYNIDEEIGMSLTYRFNTFVSPGGEYVFFVPVRWQGRITAQRTGNTITFTTYGPEAAGREELLSICVSQTFPDNREGWRLYDKDSGIYVKQPSEEDNPMVLTSDELKSCISVLNKPTEK